MNTHTYELTVESPDALGIKSLSVWTAPGTRVTKLCVVSDQDVAFYLRRYERWAALVLEERIVSGSVTLRITTDDTKPPQFERVESSRELESFDAAPVLRQMIMALEENSIRHAPDELSMRASRYFRELDVATNPTLFCDRDSTADAYCSVCSADDQAEAAADGATPKLEGQGRTPGQDSIFDRFIGSGSAALFSNAAARMQRKLPKRSMPEPIIIMLSALQTQFLRRHLSSFSSQLDARTMHNAYALFACGALQLEIDCATKDVTSRFADGGPDGAFIFLFAEFALAALDADIEPELWRAALPGLCAACELYLLCYGADEHGEVPPRPFAYYNGRAPINRIADIDRLRILESYRYKSVRQLTDRYEMLLRSAFLTNVDKEVAEVTPKRTDNCGAFRTPTRLSVSANGIQFEDGS